MKINAEVIGIDKIISQLRESVQKVEDRTKVALMRVGLALQAEAQERVPRDTGDLARSAGTRMVEKPNFGSYAVVYFGTSYAVFVHEAVNEKLKGQKRSSNNGTYWDNGRSKYLESAYRDNFDELQGIATSAMRLGL
tara:strand:- start:643 stop:1053 length:411 start_codon:yes stop_codon:yes gene_type:complete